MRNAYPRHGSRTAHVAQMALACSSRRSFSLSRSKCDGGKKTTACGPRHAARTCQSSSTCCALTDTPPFHGGPYSRSRPETRESFGTEVGTAADDVPGHGACERSVTVAVRLYDARSGLAKC